MTSSSFGNDTKLENTEERTATASILQQTVANPDFAVTITTITTTTTTTRTTLIDREYQSQPSNVLPIIVVACAASIALILVGIMCLIVAFFRRRRKLKSKVGGMHGNPLSAALGVVRVPSQAGIIQAEFIEFVLPYTSAEPTDEEFSEQEPGHMSRPLAQGYGSSSGNISSGTNGGGAGLVVVGSGGGGGGSGSGGTSTGTGASASGTAAATGSCASVTSGLLTVPQQMRRVIRLNSIAPALYLSSEGEEEQASWLPANMNFGKVGFTLRYKVGQQRLMVTIIGAKGLPMKRKTNHPHVKVVLLPEKSEKAFTRVHKNTSDPVYNEEFEFPLNPDEVADKILKISVCDFDKFSRRIAHGHVFFPLKRLSINKDVTSDIVLSDIWKNLYPKHMGNEEARGELSLSLCYCPEVRQLRLGVHKVRNLITGQEEKDIACLYAKLTLFEKEKIIKTKKTGAKRKTLEPDFEESFTIKIARKQLNDVVCTVSVCSRNRYGTRKVIGRTQLGPYTLVSGPGADHWSDALQSPNSTVTQWHTLH